LLGVVVIIVVLVGCAKLASTSGLGAKGVAARGILLEVSSQPGPSRRYGTVRYCSRVVRVDVEIPGEAPFEAYVNVDFPSNLERDVLPGATVELRVDPRNRNNISIVGPGAGFAVARLGTAQVDQGAA
jgi:hypothetical protein